MKKLFLVAMALVGFSTFSFAQKFAYVDTDYILKSIPEYNTALTTVDNQSVEWQKEIEVKYAEIDKMYRAFQAEQILLTEDMKRKRENEIINKEKDVKELQKQRFGVDGDLFKKRQELIKPVQEKVYNTIKIIAEKQALQVIFDKSSDLSILYANPKLDKSDAVLVELGYKVAPKTTKK